MLLAENHSNSILRNDLPNVMDEVVLHPGDLLYLPRGTIHEAISTDLFSTHVTISVFQKRNVKNILLSVTNRFSIHNVTFVNTRISLFFITGDIEGS